MEVIEERKNWPFQTRKQTTEQTIAIALYLLNLSVTVGKKNFLYPTLVCQQWNKKKKENE